MKKLILTMTLLASIAALTWAAEQARDGSGKSDAVEKLTARVTALETKLAEVQKEVKLLRELPRSFTVPTQPGTPTLPPYGAPEEKGEVWREGNINGWKFYVIPLSAEEAKEKR